MATQIPSSIKKVIKRSPFYALIKHFRARQALPLWTQFDQSMLKFYSHYVKHGGLCFDIGANIGNRTRVFLKLGARVVAVEPQRDCVAVLRSRYGHNRRLTVVPKAVGRSEAQTEIMINESHTISSMSAEWIEAVKRTERYGENAWERKEAVQLTTLDRLIEQYGSPSFIKIDVEGFEFDVISGLSQPVTMLSFEFTPEFIQSSLKCIERLESLGDIRLNYSFGESMQLVLDHWVTADGMVETLSRLNSGPAGDVYVRFAAPVAGRTGSPD